jgi:hypothetical protein
MDVSNRPFWIPEPVTIPKTFPNNANTDWIDGDRAALLMGCIEVTRNLHFWYQCLPWYSVVMKPARLCTLRFNVEALCAAEFEDRDQERSYIMVRSHISLVKHRKSDVSFIDGS